MNFHIQHVNNAWYGKVDRSSIPVAIGDNKNDVVSRTIAFAKKVARQSTIFIHSQDGRILETRTITNRETVSIPTETSPWPSTASRS